MIVAGIDLGAGRSKVVLLDENKNLLAFSSSKTSANFTALAHSLVRDAASEAGITESDIPYIATCGLGRYSVSFRDIQITEITCAAQGAKFLFPGTACVLDIGAQSTRAIKLQDNGKVKQFRSNDRCAAGSGGFLERAARYLEVPVDQIGKLSLKAQRAQTISSVCAVLAESEIINHVNDGAAVEEILSGIHDSLADRALSLLKRVGIDGPVTFVGGVARQAGMVKALEKKLDAPVFSPRHPELVCAYGAALLALKRIAKLGILPAKSMLVPPCHTH